MSIDDATDEAAGIWWDAFPSDERIAEVANRHAVSPKWLKARIRERYAAEEAAATAERLRNGKRQASALRWAVGDGAGVISGQAALWPPVNPRSEEE